MQEINSHRMCSLYMCSLYSIVARQLQRETPALACGWSPAWLPSPSFFPSRVQPRRESRQPEIALAPCPPPPPSERRDDKETRGERDRPSESRGRRRGQETCKQGQTKVSMWTVSHLPKPKQISLRQIVTDQGFGKELRSTRLNTEQHAKKHKHPPAVPPNYAHALTLSLPGLASKGGSRLQRSERPVSQQGGGRDICLSV
jgi:hypothetical protein